jgi:hypothetical protein
MNGRLSLFRSAVVGSLVTGLAMSGLLTARPLAADPGVLMINDDLLWKDNCEFFDDDCTLYIGKRSPFKRVQQPKAMVFARDIQFSKIRWKNWDRNSAQGVARMLGGDFNVVLPARVKFASPRTFVCRDEVDYHDKVRVRLFTRFSWTGGHRHVRGNKRPWLNHRTWYPLSPPTYVARSKNIGDVYEC